MRLKITASTNKKMLIPFNYQYVLQAAIYNLIENASAEYSDFLHNTGFIDGNKHHKLFTFSKLIFSHYGKHRSGFSNVSEFVFYFSTPIEKSYENLVLGIFTNQKMRLKFLGKKYELEIILVETLPEINYKKTMKMVCLSPIAISTGETSEYYHKQHFADYMDSKERNIFIFNLKNNLLAKYNLVHHKEFAGNTDFEFSFDPNYIINKKGKISKLITFKDNIKIKAMEAPFKITAEPELIKIGYECGFGEKNSGGFGMAKVIENENEKNRGNNGFNKII